MLTTNPHPGDHIEEQAAGLPDTTENTIRSVPNAFSLIHLRTNYNSFHELNTFASNEYTELHNHFQGIQRLRDGQHFVISGGSKKDKKANLLICKAKKYGLSPKSTTKFYGFNRLESAIGSNVLKGGETPEEDTVVGIYQLNKGLDEFWHAGGMDVCGDILAVPLETQVPKLFSTQTAQPTRCVSRWKNPPEGETFKKVTMKNTDWNRRQFTKAFLTTSKLFTA